MKLVHDSHSAYVDSRLERLISGRRRRRLQSRENTPAPGNTPRGNGNTPKKAA